ncbi:MAG TPA: hypothetical protein VGI81_22165 [Tepidisphaeraceae bacterium]|jgi:hypothetical protein
MHIANYKAILIDCFGVRCEAVVILPNFGAHDLKQAHGYNAEMSDAIAKRCLRPASVVVCTTPTRRDTAARGNAADSRPPPAAPSRIPER